MKNFLFSLGALLCVLCIGPASAAEKPEPNYVDAATLTLVNKPHATKQPFPRVEVADTVGAGDAFTATFAASLMQGLPMEECHRRAVAVAAIVCTRHGAIAPLSEFMKTEITNR